MKKPSYPITFLRTQNLEETRQFYSDILNLPVVLDQGECIIVGVGKYGFWGFCENQEILEFSERVCMTLVFETREEVDDWHKHLVENNVEVKREPQYTQRYQIYNAFYVDPSGHTLEIQAFDDAGKPIGHDNCLE